jgi:hypothetical protein
MTTAATVLPECRPVAISKSCNMVVAVAVLAVWWPAADVSGVWRLTTAVLKLACIAVSSNSLKIGMYGSCSYCFKISLKYSQQELS